MNSQQEIASTSIVFSLEHSSPENILDTTHKFTVFSSDTDSHENDIASQLQSSSVFSFEELKKLTHEKKEENKIKFSDRIKIGRDDAINHITQGCYDKMKLSASKGFDTSIIYSFSWVNDPEAKVDNNGNKTVFEGNIRLSDLINKDRINFIEALNKYFNHDGEDKFHCYVKKNNFKGETVWTINVSWGEKPQKEYKPYRKEYDANENPDPFNGIGKVKHFSKLKNDKSKYASKKKFNKNNKIL